MHARLVRSVVVVVTVTGPLIWAPNAHAQPSEPPPSTSAAPAETPALDTGSVEITSKDAAGNALPGAMFLLLDSVGAEAGRGETDVQGTLFFSDLEPGVYRLKQTASGSPLHDVAADEDVIVTPGATAPVTVIDPFTSAHLTLKAKDDKTGKALPGSTFNIGTGDEILLTLVTGLKGTALRRPTDLQPCHGVLGEADKGTRRLHALQALEDLHRRSRHSGYRDRHQLQDHDGFEPHSDPGPDRSADPYGSRAQ
ncbi:MULTISPECIES: MSCRAMM family protein [unclassified Streptomyces]|uniref:MSCRAMM family protein n=1 Tax=unclassified Streptomyces TaxID=2593676 RepID=UPI00403D0A90